MPDADRRGGVRPTPAAKSIGYTSAQVVHTAVRRRARRARRDRGQRAGDGAFPRDRRGASRSPAGRGSSNSSCCPEKTRAEELHVAPVLADRLLELEEREALAECPHEIRQEHEERRRHAADPDPAVPEVARPHAYEEANDRAGAKSPIVCFRDVGEQTEGEPQPWVRAVENRREEKGAPHPQQRLPGIHRGEAVMTRKTGATATLIAESSCARTPPPSSRATAVSRTSAAPANAGSSRIVKSEPERWPSPQQSAPRGTAACRCSPEQVLRAGVEVELVDEVLIAEAPGGQDMGGELDGGDRPGARRLRAQAAPAVDPSFSSYCSFSAADDPSVVVSPRTRPPRCRAAATSAMILPERVLGRSGTKNLVRARDRADLRAHVVADLLVHVPVLRSGRQLLPFLEDHEGGDRGALHRTRPRPPPARRRSGRPARTPPPSCRCGGRRRSSRVIEPGRAARSYRPHPSWRRLRESRRPCSIWTSRSARSARRRPRSCGASRATGAWDREIAAADFHLVSPRDRGSSPPLPERRGLRSPARRRDAGQGGNQDHPVSVCHQATTMGASDVLLVPHPASGLIGPPTEIAAGAARRRWFLAGPRPHSWRAV